MPHPLANDRTVVTTQDLIRFDTTNYGGGRSKGEREAAEYLQRRLESLGLEVTSFESEPRRTSIVTRVAGRNPDKPALVVHGHTDVVPADPEGWTFDPFAAEIHDGMLWGRGAVDMKNMDAMILTSLEDILTSGRRPERDLIVAFFADEEAGGERGAYYGVTHHPELFAGATEAISEVGGYSIQLDTGQRAYLVQTGEKALIWCTLRVRRPAGHGSRSIPAGDNAISVLAETIVRLTEHEWPLHLTDTTHEMIAALQTLLGAESTELAPDELVLRAGSAATWLTASLRSTTNPTMLAAGSKHNVVPATATVAIDCRPLPGMEDEVFDQIRAIAGEDVEIEIEWRDIGTEAPSTGPIVDAMTASLDAHDPGATIVPYLLPAGTDNKSLARLGIHGYGFAPLRLPAELDFPAMFHGVDERVPLESIVFGREVLTTFLTTY